MNQHYDPANENDREEQAYEWVLRQEKHVTLAQLRTFMRCQYREAVALVNKRVESGVWRRVYKGKRAIGITDGDRLPMPHEQGVPLTIRENAREQQRNVCPTCDRKLGPRPVYVERAKKLLCYGCGRALSYAESRPGVLRRLADFAETLRTDLVVPTSTITPASNIRKPDIVPASSPGPRLAFETKPAPKKYPEHWLETLETDFPE